MRRTAGLSRPTSRSSRAAAGSSPANSIRAPYRAITSSTGSTARSRCFVAGAARPPALVAGLAWAAHVAVDRAVGYGLRDAGRLPACLATLAAPGRDPRRGARPAGARGRWRRSPSVGSRRARIRPPSLYKHFAGQREIEALLIADGLERSRRRSRRPADDLAAIAAAYRAFALAQPQLYRLMTERPLPRDELPDGLEARAAAPLSTPLGDPDLARAVWAFAHGMVQLELAGRFPPGADLDAAWARAIAAFAPPDPPGNQPEATKERRPASMSPGTAAPS